MGRKHAGHSALRRRDAVGPPAGEYALIAYHDQNGNREIAMRIFGMPKEPAGVSNDARGRFGRPGFDAAKFELNAPLTRHAFELRCPLERIEHV